MKNNSDNNLILLHYTSDKKHPYYLLPPASVGLGKVLFSVCQSTPRRGGVPDPALGGGGGVQGLRLSGGGGKGSQVSDFRVGGVPGLRFFGGGGRYLVSVKGKIFDTRFGLIHVQTGKNFLSRDPPPPKGKNF